MSKYIKNNDTATHTWSGQEILAGQYHLIDTFEEKKWADDAQLLIDISNGIAIVSKDNSGTQDITDVAEAINYLKDTDVKTVNSKNFNFTSNVTEDGKLLYTKIHGMKAVIASGQTHKFEFTIPYTEIYFIGAEILVDVLSVSDFRVKHPIAGELEKYGFAVNMGKILYKRESRYAARLPQGLIIECECTNDDAGDLEMGVNFIMHEIRDPS